MTLNADKTNCSTLTNPPQGIAEKGSKQIRTVTSGERGTLVITSFSTNAAGGFLTIIFVIPRVNYKDIMLGKGTLGTPELANISKEINEEYFIKVCDNYSSHVNLRVALFVRENSIAIVSIPPYCSHKLQPLDVTLYCLFKIKYRITMNE